MKRATFTSLATGLLFVAVATAIGLAQSQPRRDPRRHRRRSARLSQHPRSHRQSTHTPRLHPHQDHNAVIRQYCVTCHNDKRKDDVMGLSLQTFDIAKAADSAATAEKMILKLQAGMMPPPGARRPDPSAQLALVNALETTVDRAAAARPIPGRRTFPASQSRGVRAPFASCSPSTSTPASGCRSTR